MDILNILKEEWFSSYNYIGLILMTGRESYSINGKLVSGGILKLSIRNQYSFKESITF